ncbi:MAG: DUF3570 domain-containing protein [Polyangiaceae bacterium]
MGAATSILMVASPATAQVFAADARTSVYQDTDATTIVTTAVGATANPIPELSISGRYLADVITTASVDVVAAATDRWEEVRHEGLGSIGYHDTERSISGTYIYSVENDWRSHTGSLTLSHDLLSHQLTLGASGSFVYNEVGRSHDANFDERLLVGTANVEAAIVASPDDLLAVTYSFIYQTGYLESPYRFVRFDGPLSGAAVGAPERVPDSRARNAVGLRYHRHLGGHSFLRLTTRGYVDDWGIVSGTLGVEFVEELASVVELGIFSRGYAQTGATFYEATYPEERAYMTSDRELSPFVDAFGGARIGFDVRDAGPFYSLRGDLKATGFLFHFFEFPALTDRYGVIAELGLGASL